MSSIVVGRCACGGDIEPVTNGMGVVSDRCVRCGAAPGQGKPRGTQRWGTGMRTAVGVKFNGNGAISGGGVSTNAGKKCPVAGCPGEMDRDGVCQPCRRRRAFAEAHRPTHPCPICGGEFIKRGRARTCAACKPFAGYLKAAG